jgi:hypothetical protein
VSTTTPAYQSNARLLQLTIYAWSMVFSIISSTAKAASRLLDTPSCNCQIERECRPCAKITPSATVSAPATHVRRYVFSVT